MTLKCGFCMAPDGARPKHRRGKPVIPCPCPCHVEKEDD